MRILSYSGESLVTTDGVGEAVVDYVRALIAHNSTDVVDIPVLFKQKELIVSMVLGSASQLMIVHSHDDDVELQDESTIESLRAKTAALGPHPVLPIEPQSVHREDPAFDLL